MSMRLSSTRYLSRLMVPGLLLVSLLLGACSTSAYRDQEPLPPVTMQATHERHPGKFVWHDLITPDPVASRDFYGKLFGWTFREQGNYTIILNDGQPIGGMLRLPRKEDRPAVADWLASLSVNDVDKAVSAMASRGGKLVTGPRDMPLRGRAALIRDPDGAYLILLHTKDGDPVDRQPPMGAWLWNEHWTKNLPRTRDFYLNLGQYEAIIEEEDYVILINEKRWRAGIRDVKDSSYAGRWVPVVRVADPAAMVARVEKLGGVVWVRPGEHKRNPDVALIADTLGGLLMLQRWTFKTEGGAK